MAAWRVLKKARQAAIARHAQQETGEIGADADMRDHVARGACVPDKVTRHPAASATAEFPGELEPHAARNRSRRERRSAGLGL
jgi:hypothetical protein